MIIEIDIGNSRIKWRLLGESGGNLTFAADLDELYAQLASLAQPVKACRVVMVRSITHKKTAITNRLAALLMCPVLFAKSQSTLGGVVNGYSDVGALGVDRWLAIIAGFALQGGPCLILDAGTALTADFVDSNGNHLGGLIVPGVTALGSLLSQTTGLNGLPEHTLSGPQSTTEHCIAAGLNMLLHGFVNEVSQQASQVLGDSYRILVTGGDSHVLADLLPSSVIVDDLVFRGLALACPV